MPEGALSRTTRVPFTGRKDIEDREGGGEGSVWGGAWVNEGTKKKKTGPRQRNKNEHFTNEVPERKLKDGEEEGETLPFMVRTAGGPEERKPIKKKGGGRQTGWKNAQEKEKRNRPWMA